MDFNYDFKRNYDHSKPHKFVVTETTGEYDTTHTRPIAVYDTEDEADEHVNRAQNRQERIEEIAVRNKTYDVTGNDEEDYQYEKLHDKFIVYIFKKMFPRLKDVEFEYDYDVELTDDESEIYDRMNEPEELKKYMVEVAGYSEEVAEATIMYNFSEDFGDFCNAYYTWVAVPYLSAQNKN